VWHTALTSSRDYDVSMVQGDRIGLVLDTAQCAVRSVQEQSTHISLHHGQIIIIKKIMRVLSLLVGNATMAVAGM
jgi:hypothetical protein